MISSNLNHNIKKIAQHINNHKSLKKEEKTQNLKWIQKIIKRLNKDETESALQYLQLKYLGSFKNGWELFFFLRDCYFDNQDGINIYVDLIYDLTKKEVTGHLGGPITELSEQDEKVISDIESHYYLFQELIKKEFNSLILENGFENKNEFNSFWDINYSIFKDLFECRAQQVAYGFLDNNEKSIIKAIYKYHPSNENFEDAIKDLNRHFTVLLKGRDDVRWELKSAGYKFPLPDKIAELIKLPPPKNAIKIFKYNDIKIKAGERSFVQLPRLERLVFPYYELLFEAQRNHPIFTVIDESTCIEIRVKLFENEEFLNDTKKISLIGEKIIIYGKELFADHLKNIKKTRENLNKGKVTVWELPVVCYLTLLALGYDVHYEMQSLEDISTSKSNDIELTTSPLFNIVQGEIDEVRYKKVVVKLVLAAAAIGLCIASIIVSSGTTSIPVLFALIELLSVVIAVYSTTTGYQEYLILSRASKTHYEQAQAISLEEPSFTWVVVDLLGAGLDVLDLLKALKGLIPLIKTTTVGRKITELKADLTKVLVKANPKSDINKIKEGVDSIADDYKKITDFKSSKNYTWLSTTFFKGTKKTDRENVVLFFALLDDTGQKLLRSSVDRGLPKNIISRIADGLVGSKESRIFSREFFRAFNECKSEFIDSILRNYLGRLNTDQSQLLFPSGDN